MPRISIKTIVKADKKIVFDLSRMKALFDGEWIYNPQNTSITQIRNMVNEIDRN